MAKWWLIIGSPQNWQTAFENGNLWGLKETQRNIWEHLEKGDRVILYAGHPVGGIIGFGSMRGTLIQDSPLWPEEVRQNRVLWPLRVELDVEYCLPQDRWPTDRIATEPLTKRARRRQMLQMVEESFARELLADAFPGVLKTDLFEVAAEAAIPSSLHDQLIDGLVESGRLQGFVSEKEYAMEGNRLDVVWRRVARSVPNYVFEVQVGGDIYHALAKLKHAFDLWNSNIFLVAGERDRRKADQLLSGTFHEIASRLGFIEIEKAQELVKRKRAVRELEVELGILP